MDEMDPVHEVLQRHWLAAKAAGDTARMRMIEREHAELEGLNPQPEVEWTPQRAAVYAGRHVSELPPRQALALSHVVMKMLERGRTEVGMSRRELARISNMTPDGAKRALNGLVADGLLRRTTNPLLEENRIAQEKQRKKGRGYWFYNVPRESLPAAFAGPILPPPTEGKGLGPY